MVFYLIGLGLGDVKDITVKGLELVRKCDRVYLETYTSILCYGLQKDALEEFYGRSIIEADRDLVEQGSDELLRNAKKEDICLLVVGDPFGATTHSDLLLRAREWSIEVGIVHNASIMNAIGCCGLQLYNFGETVSIVFWEETWTPTSFAEKINENISRGMHTLCLLDIKTKEQSVDNMMRGRKIYEKPRYMTCAQAADQLLQICAQNDQCKYSAISRCVGLARIGWSNQKIVFSTLSQMSSIDMGDPLHSLIICGQLHPIEEQLLNFFAF